MNEVKQGMGWKKGCLTIAAGLFGLIVIGSIIGSEKDQASQSVGGTALVGNNTPKIENSATDQAAESANLTSAQRNAARSAQQYVNMTGFSRAGLIDQLSSDAGDGYSTADATAAVDSLNIDWNENAARSAKQYLNMSGFSCKGLIEQLSSSAGDKYTVEQATYGAHQAGAC